MVIGKRICDKEWYIGNQIIQETNFYKYLGVMINRQISETHHINEHLKTKASKLQGYVRYTLGRHHSINRVHFGTSMWDKAIFPSLAHACGVWFCNTETSKKTIKSIQYSFAKAVMKINSMPSTFAILGDLGWLPMKEKMDIGRIGYFNYVCSLPESRLAKCVLRELIKVDAKQLDTNFSYIKNIKQILTEKGLDHMFDAFIADSNPNLNQKYKQFITANYKETFHEQLANCSSLKHYRIVKEDTSVPGYMESKVHSFKQIQLKFKLRSGISNLGEDILRQNRGP